MSDTDDKVFLLGCLGSIVIFILLWVITDNFIVAFFIGFALALVSNLYAAKKKREQNEKEETLLMIHLKTVRDFTASQHYITEDKKHLVAVDTVVKKVCFVDDRYGGRVKVYSYKDLVRSEIVEDGHSVTTTSRASQLGGAILGGMVAGGAGAMIGALTGRKSTSSEVKNITLQVTLDDIEEPLRYIRFLYVVTPISKNTEMYQNASKEANHWHGLISVLIRRADEFTH
ncbi:hypothetical protein MNQ98_04405 [Paenibacillus sp. N3/727]|uniref:hypothetical protein n=1 Tax=Paenibacillus sp. N3/727 TaxID=2925845 RepID=UPI001F5334FC|nr:hypothetical protein [Paenibacillus sp. N3/727]UNK19286.1 hypothetical protein MNQ98_04405 [Paenibacillus sp. N3/727]